MSRKLKGGGCGCGSSSGLLGFPQNGGNFFKGMFGKKQTKVASNPFSSTPIIPSNGSNGQLKQKSSNSGIGMSSSSNSGIGMSSNSNSGMRVSSQTSKISAGKIIHKNGRSLNDHIEDVHKQLNEIQSAQGSSSSGMASPGLFGGGLFDFLMPKPHAPPMPQPTGVSQRTLPTNQPPTLQEVVRDLQFRVKALEEETHPPSVGGYRATKRNLNALKKWKQGKSIGFTMRSSLKAKGLIPRANGTRRVSKKYQ
jgi:hypothetical protein